MRTRTFVAWIVVTLLATTVVGPAASGQETAPEKLDEARQRVEEARRALAEATRELVRLEGDHDLLMPRPMVWTDPSRAYLGVVLRSQEHGTVATIAAVTPGGPADEAGVKAGDAIVSVNGEAVESGGDEGAADRVRDLVSDLEDGDEVTLVLRRDGDDRTVTVTARPLTPADFALRFAPGLGLHGDDDTLPWVEAPEMPEMPDLIHVYPLELLRRWRDMELVRVTADLGSYFGTDEGLLVVRPPDDASLGLRGGDVILSIGGRAPADPSHALRILRSYEPGETIPFELMRHQHRITVRVEVPQRDARRGVRGWWPPRSGDDAEPRPDGAV